MTAIMSLVVAARRRMIAVKAVGVAVATAAALSAACYPETRTTLFGRHITTPFAKSSHDATPREQGERQGQNSDEECDCSPLWNCITDGGQCNALQAQLDSCLAASRTRRLP
jgi:hypothetical protein